ncbi:hypothetical protein IEQ34_002838 [Dendrobium chrysotoxum]|uniref:2-phosphoglycerate kinase n=1 Tax=Dendrobium chrysotoxum TaxID=161865 RepID=A0AAV7H137_DENCH|nr:hypothetical protein IEQ34_002838 [Dendrobium chrysotoxum]
MGEGAPERGVREGISKLSVSVSLPSSTGESLENKADSASIPSARFSARNASSKYDFVKVKVWLGDNADHYYVLSRFLLSRMLTVTKIPNHVAIKIALELKKLLIDNSLLDVSQSDLEANLFKLMERRGYGEEYINRYKMMTRFHHQRVPLVILVCGTACTGKSTISTQLAQRLNLPNVLQTDMVYELLRTSTDAPLAGTPVWAREFNSSEELITEFCRECRIVRKGLAGDLKKAMKDGKPIIIEGIHLDPSIYLMDEDKREISLVHGENTEHGNANSDFPAEEKVKCASASELNSTCIDKEDKECYYEREGIEINKSSPHYLDNKKCPENPRHKESNPVEKGFSFIKYSSIFFAWPFSFISFCGSSSTNVGFAIDTCYILSMITADEGPKDPDARSICPVNKAKPAVDPIIVPIVLKMAEFDHKALLEEWISTRTYGENCPVQDQDKLIHNLKTIENYLCSFDSQVGYVDILFLLINYCFLKSPTSTRQAKCYHSLFQSWLIYIKYRNFTKQKIHINQNFRI